MQYEKSHDTFDLTYAEVNRLFIGVWFVVIGIAALIFPGILLQAPEFIVGAAAFIIAGLAIGLTRLRIHTVITKADGLIRIERTTFPGKPANPTELPISHVVNAELAAFRYGRYKSQTGRVLYLNTNDGSKLKIAARQDPIIAQLLTKVTAADIINLGTDITDFLGIPLDQGDKWRILDT